MIKQRTLKTLVRATGVGVHTGHKVAMVLRPAPVDTGIVVSFERMNQSNFIWVYTPDNHFVGGDGWNHEDFSIVDPAQKPRAETAWARPYARAIKEKRPPGVSRAFALARLDIAELRAAIAAYRTSSFHRKTAVWASDRRADRAFVAIGARNCGSSR